MNDRILRAALAMVASFGVLLALFGAVGALAQTVNICDRTPQVRDEIMLAIGASDCATVTAAQLAGVTELCFGHRPWGRGCRSAYSRGDLLALKSGDFAGLTGLESLLLMQNQLTALPEDLFAGLTSLQILRLDQNHYGTLPEGLFAGLTSLNHLTLTDGYLSDLPDSLFAGLTNLNNLQLQMNYLAVMALTRDHPLLSNFPAGGTLFYHDQKNIGELQSFQNLAFQHLDALEVRTDALEASQWMAWARIWGIRCVSWRDD